MCIGCQLHTFHFSPLCFESWKPTGGEAAAPSRPHSLPDSSPLLGAWKNGESFWFVENNMTIPFRGQLAPPCLSGWDFLYAFCLVSLNVGQVGSECRLGRSSRQFHPHTVSANDTCRLECSLFLVCSDVFSFHHSRKAFRCIWLFFHSFVDLGLHSEFVAARRTPSSASPSVNSGLTSVC